MVFFFFNEKGAKDIIKIHKAETLSKGFSLSLLRSLGIYGD